MTLSCVRSRSEAPSPNAEITNLNHSERRHPMWQRRSYLALTIGLISLLGALSLIAPNRGHAQQTGGLPDLEHRVAALEAKINSQQATIDDLRAKLNTETAARIQGDAATRLYADSAVGAEMSRAKAAEAALQTSVSSLEALTAPLSLSGTELTFTGVNVHIVSGSGRTDDFIGSGGTLTGLGNLIVGYPGGDSIYPRTGSHNVVLGDHNGYTSYGGLVAGQGNQILGPYCTITGGTGNTARNYWSSVNGGFSNIANGQGSVVNGGQQNSASESYAAVSGGYLNVVTAFRGWAGGAYHSP
jgi:hypothetical protein